MRRHFIIAAAVGTALAVVAPVQAAPKPKPPKPVTTVLHLHGRQTVDDGASVPGVGGFNTMDKTAGAAAKSRFIINYGAGPNTQCAGNGLLPVWVGDLKGTVTGDVVVKFRVVQGSGGSVEVRLWPDVTEGACNAAYVNPKRSKTVTLPTSGVVTVKLSGKSFVAKSALMLQLTPVLVPPFVSRISYDGSGEDDGTVTLSCTPSAGKKTCA